MSRLYLKSKRFNKKIKRSLVRKKVISRHSPEAISKIFSTYCRILLINKKYHSLNDLKKTNEFKELLKEFKDSVKKSIKLQVKTPYKFISSNSVYFLSSLFNNQNINNIFIKVFWSKSRPKNLETVLSSLLNDVIYLFAVASKYKKVKNYIDIKEQDVTLFTNILEINKNFHKKIQILFPRQSNPVIVFVNSLLNI